MAAELPPPLYRGESALLTYAKALGTLLPTLFFWGFSMLFVMPKLEWLWAKTNMEGTRADWLMDGLEFAKAYFWLIVAPLVLLLVVLELTVKNWRRYRAAVIGTLTVLINAAVLLLLTWISVSVLVAAPLLTRKEKTPPASEATEEVGSDELSAEEAGTPQ